MNLDRDIIDVYLNAHPAPLLFVTVSGAHLYGFESSDSDYDLRGAHVTPVEEFVRLKPPRETVDVLDKGGKVEVDLVTHDVAKFFKLLLGKNGYALEQVFSPIVVQSAGTAFDELRDIAARTITKHHHYHFERFSMNQWERVAGPSRGTVKGLLYTYRPLMAGIHLMRTGAIESNINTLNEVFDLGEVRELVELKRNGHEKDPLPEGSLDRHRALFERLRVELHDASEGSGLPDTPLDEARGALDDLLVRLRLGRP